MPIPVTCEKELGSLKNVIVLLLELYCSELGFISVMYFFFWFALAGQLFINLKNTHIVLIIYIHSVPTFQIL